MESVNNVVTDFEARVAQARQEKLAKYKQDTMALLDNKDFMNAQVKSANLADERVKLDTIITQLNTAITAFIAKDGTKYSVRVFPVSQFGIGLDRLVGIIAGSASAFTDEMALEYEAIVGVPFVELQLANQVLGTVDYLNKDAVYVEGSRSLECEEYVASNSDGTPLDNIAKRKEYLLDSAKQLQIAIQSLAIKLELYELVPTVEQLTTRLTSWETSARNRANKQLAELRKRDALNEASQFTIED